MSAVGRRVWVTYVIATAAVLAILAVLTGIVLKLERDAERARARQAAVERMKEALWRLDAFVVPVIGRQAAFAYSHYVPAYVPTGLYTSKGEAKPPEQVFVEISPILTTTWPGWVKLHFSAPLEGGIASPELPTGRHAWVQRARGMTSHDLAQKRRLLQQLGTWLGGGTRTTLAARSDGSQQMWARDLVAQQVVLPPRRPRAPVRPKPPLTAQRQQPPQQQKIAVAANNEPAPRARQRRRGRYFRRGNTQMQVPEPVDNAMLNVYRPKENNKKKKKKSKKGADEQQIKLTKNQDKTTSTSSPLTLTFKSVNKPRRPRPPVRPRYRSLEVESKLLRVEVSDVSAAWIDAPGAPGGKTLILYRSANIQGKRMLQGSLLDWPALRQAMLDEIADLFPPGGGAAAEAIALLPAPAPVARRDDWLASGSSTLYGGAEALNEEMSTLPVVVRAGVPAAQSLALSPVRVALLITWALALMALVVTGAAVRSTSDLAQRRMNFVSAVSHELRAPLTALRMYLDMLADGMITSEEKRAEVIKTLQGQAERLSGQVRGVLDYARLERQTFQAHRHQVQLSELLAQLEQACRDRCAASGLELALVGQGELPGDEALETDPEAVIQIVLNLVDNACKYAAEAAAPIRLAVNRQQGALVIEVSDEGPGIPPRARRRLFDAFYRVGDEMTREHTGVGLGLAISRGFARALGAKLELVGQPRDDGTLQAAFALRLPLGA
jgi:signal transduction histidine kinase